MPQAFFFPALGTNQNSTPTLGSIVSHGPWFALRWGPPLSMIINAMHCCHVFETLTYAATC